MSGNSYGSIYRPGAMAYPDLGIYDNFPDAFAASLYLAEPAVTLDPTYGDIDIPSGTYVLPTVFTLFGLNYATVQFNNGVVFEFQEDTGPGFIFNGLNVVNNKTDAPLFTVPDDCYASIIGLNTCAFASSATATQPLVAQTGTGVAYVDMQDGTTLGDGSGTTAPLFYNSGSKNMEIIQGGWSTLGPNVMSGSKFTYVPVDGSNTWTKQQAATNIGWLVGGGSVVAEVIATNTTALSVPSSTPTTVTGWTVSANTSPDASGEPFDPSTGIFTAPVTGSYLVQHTEEYAAPATAPGVGAEFSASIVHGAAVVAQQAVYSVGAATKFAITVSETVVMAMGDTLEVQTSQNSGSTQALSGVAVRNRLSITFQPTR